MFFPETTAVPKREKIGHRNEEGKKNFFFAVEESLCTNRQKQEKQKTKNKTKK